MAQLTVTGGLNHPAITLQFSADDLAFKQAELYAGQVKTTYGDSVPVIYNPGQTQVPSAGYAIVPSSVTGMIDVRGFGAVTIENTHRDTVEGGTRGDQIVLAGSGGLDFSSARGNVTVVAGGGDNLINFSRNHNAPNTGDNAVYLSATTSDSNTVIGGDGNTTIAAGEGTNYIYTAAGNTDVISTGHDLIRMSVGADTVNVMAGASDTVYGGTSSSTLMFNGGTLASTVLGAQGSVSVMGGSGGGFFRGGKDGNNMIYGGSGSVTILGGGAGDSLIGGTGTNDVIRASTGNETLGGGSGSTTFQFYDYKNAGSPGVIDHITNWNSTDVIKLIGAGINEAINYALNTYTIGTNSSSFRLEDGTKVVLDGYTGPLSHSNFS